GRRLCRAGGGGHGESGCADGAGGSDGTAHGDAAGRERYAAQRPGGDLGEQQHGGRDGERQRARDGRGRRLGADHGDQRGAGRTGTAAITVTAPTGQLAIGDSVQATVSTWVRNIAQPPADPATGTPPSVIGTQPAGARGVVDSGPVLNTTPGGDGAIRYHVLFAAAPSGWVVQDYLAKIVPTVPVAAVTVT